MLTVVWAYRRTGKFAFHVLTGALEIDARTVNVPIEFANGVDAVQRGGVREGGGAAEGRAHDDDP